MRRVMNGKRRHPSKGRERHILHTQHRAQIAHWQERSIILFQRAIDPYPQQIEEVYAFPHPKTSKTHIYSRREEYIKNNNNNRKKWGRGTISTLLPSPHFPSSSPRLLHLSYPHLLPSFPLAFPFPSKELTSLTHSREEHVIQEQSYGDDKENQLP